MCGIVVVFGKNSRQKTKNCLGKIQHRGPDAYEIITIDQGNISIGFVRLSINDRTAKGNQPFVLDNYIGVFNAEIYNNKSLIEKYNLKTQGFCDAEVILPLFQKIGKKSLLELDGFFSGVIINKKTKQVFLLRDYIGKKPMFFSYDKNTKYIVSEMKALPCVNAFQAVPKGLCTISGTSIQSILQYKKPNGKLKNPQEVLKNAFHDAINKRIEGIKGMKFGVFLSGGLDSTIVATLISRSALAGKVHYYYIADSKHADYRYIQILKKYLNINDENISNVDLPNETQLEGLISKVVYSIESRNPSIISNGIGSYILSKKAHKDGIKVVLTGDGADEMFLGYQSSDIVREDTLWREKRHAFLNDLHLTELRRIDLACMAHSIELRCPFLDKAIYDIANNLQYSDFFGESEGSLNKNILRQIFKDELPAEIINRKKVSFDVGSGLQKLMVEFCINKNISEKDYLKEVWHNHFSANLASISEDPYFWSYPQFDKVIDNRGAKYAS